MPRQVFFFDSPDRFVAGTVGAPGERTFFLQARAATRVVSVALEKQQVAVLADRLEQLLDEVSRRGTPAVAPGPELPADVEPLDTPLLEEFRVGAMALAWDGEDDVVVIEAQAQLPPDSDAEVPEPLTETDEGPDVLRVRLSPAAARAFAVRAARLVAGGRPPCPLCGLPLDSNGHVCPRQNGHRH